MRILGIDPGYDRVGIAIVDKDPKQKESLFYSECLQTSSKDPFYTRLGQVGNKIADIIEKYRPDAMAIESLFITKNQKTAMRVAEARGVIAYEAVRENIPIFEYTPLQIKIAVTGHGTSDKGQILKILPLLIDLGDKKKEGYEKIRDDEYDAIAVALTCLASEKVNFISRK